MVAKGLFSFGSAFFLFTATIFAAEIHVGPKGDDANTGSVERPLKTFAAAQKAARSLKGRGAVTVLFHGGTYYLPETIVFTAEDSGTQTAPIVYKAAPSEEVVLSGGARLDLSWKPYRNGILQAQLPPGASTDQLFVGGERQPMARYPNFDPNQRILGGYASDAISAERAKRWADPRGGFIHAMHAAMWGDFHYVITGKKADGSLEYEGGWQNNRRMGMHGEYRFVENIFEELDAPGEWFLDGKTQTLYFYPPAGIDLATAPVEIVRLRHLIEFLGSASAPVKFITLDGFTFRHAARTFMDNKEPLLRSDWTTYRGGAIFFNGSEDCALVNSFLDQVGGNAVFVNNYNRRLSVRGCQIAAAGGNGVAFVGDPAAVRSPLMEYGQRQDLKDIDLTPGPKTDNYPADCVVEDSLIYLTGRVEKQTAPIQISMSQGIQVRYCSIYDVPRAGINIGDGCWGGHVIEHCDVFDTVKETGDHGSFNSWGRDRYWGLGGVDLHKISLDADTKDLPLLDCVKPIVLRNNRWRCDHGWDIDLDDGSSNYELTNNLCLHGGIKLREGFYRRCENNIMVDNSFHPHVWFHNSQDIFLHNIVFGAYQPIGVSQPWGKQCDDNLRHRPGQTTESPAVELQKQSGLDAHSLEADAMFVAPAAGDYRVGKDSPALKLGFKNFPMDAFGVRNPELRRIARTPELLGATPAASAGGAAVRDGHSIAWRGAMVKNLIGLGEMSATGLGAEQGVRVVKAPATGAPAKAILKENDVLQKLNGKATASLEDLLRLDAAAPANKNAVLTVWREQKAIELPIEGGQVLWLSPRDAKRVGEGPQPVFDADKDFLGSWQNEQIALQWQVKMQQPGTYAVVLIMASPQEEGEGLYEVQVGQKKLPGIRPKTGGWETFVLESLGTADIATAGSIAVAVTPLKKLGAVMNLRAVVLLRQ